jgi:uncharacterized membrane protein YecN with MAPEG domain
MPYSIQIVGVYVGINLLINLFLAYRVSASRVKNNVLSGTDGCEPLYNASRAHVLNVEYLPIGLIGIVVLHLLSASIYVIHVVGLALTIGRILHAIGLSTNARAVSKPRIIGSLLTWISQLIAGVGCLYYAFF